MNDLTFVERAVSLLASTGVDTWVSGGWGEELRGLIKPREHVDVDLLYPAEDWTIVDNLSLDWVEGKRFDWKRAFRLDGITVANTHILDFNTITANIGSGPVDTGIACGTVTVPLTFSDNIVYANLVSGGGAQVGGSARCATTYSDIGPDAVSGLGNINADPMFVSSTNDDFHVASTSPVRDAADPAATRDKDFDGDARPQGPRRDMGADEVSGAPGAGR